MHDCPDCGSACHCQGDIEDHHNPDPKYEQGCTHCAHTPNKPDEDWPFDTDSAMSGGGDES